MNNQSVMIPLKKYQVLPKSIVLNNTKHSRNALLNITVKFQFVILIGENLSEKKYYN